MPQAPPVSAPPLLEPYIPGRLFWAKLSEDRTSYHPLIAHSADVAAVLERLLRPDSVLAERIARSTGAARLSDHAIAQLVYLAALHDFGKVNHGFQSQRSPRVNRSPGHVQVVLESLRYPPLTALWRELLTSFGAPPSDASELLRTVICHHGRPLDVPPSKPNDALWAYDPATGRDPLAEVRRLAGLARVWSELAPSPVAAESIPLTPHFLHLFAGALTLADWVASTRSAFDFAPWAEDEPDRYWRHARERADHACTQIGLTPRTSVHALSGLPLLQRIFPHLFSPIAGGRKAANPSPLQRHIAAMGLPTPGSRVLIESETGSGKTEAALALFARLRAAGRVGGLVFALPTRATAKAMYDRVRAAVEAMYAPGLAPTVVLAMGGGQAQPAATETLMAASTDTYPDEADRELVQWSSSSNKKHFAAEIVIGTLDQMLLAGLAVKHAHLRLAASSRHLLVIDELHSYDRYMAEVLRSVLDIHSVAGGIALLMSATLSDRERLRFGGTLRSEDEQTPLSDAVGRLYPVVSLWVRPGEPWTDTKPRTRRAVKPIKPPLRWRIGSEADGLIAAIDAARGGARVCVLRNTVKGARATIEQLSQLLGPVEAAQRLWRPVGSAFAPPYHSRYTLPDRHALDAAVLGSFGRGQRAEDGRILVSTQVVEQSLDVDFDVMVTDLCPIDVLLQRLGRVWRHRKRDGLRPAACRELQMWVIEPETGLAALLNRPMGGPNGWGTVYKHLGFLELTRRSILEAPGGQVEVPRDNRRLIESVYHVDPQAALIAETAEWSHHFTTMDGEVLCQDRLARQAVIRFDQTYIGNALRFAQTGEASIRTRLGDDRVRVTLPIAVAGYYDESAPSVTTVDLPYEKLAGAGLSNEDLRDPRATGGTRVQHAGMTYSCFALGSFRFAYSPSGWLWDAADLPPT